MNKKLDAAIGRRGDTAIRPPQAGHIRWSKLIVIAVPAALFLLLASDPNAGGDWPMWGGTADRNMVSPMKGIPTTWDVKTKKNIKWEADLGSQSYGNPVVAGGQVYVGTNNEGPKD